MILYIGLRNKVVPRWLVSVEPENQQHKLTFLSTAICIKIKGYYHICAPFGNLMEFKEAHNVCINWGGKGVIIYLNLIIKPNYFCESWLTGVIKSLFTNSFRQKLVSNESDETAAN